MRPSAASGQPAKPGGSTGGPTTGGHGEAAAADRKFVTALARGLEILRAFTPIDGLLGNQELAQRTGLPKPTVSRLTYTLTKLGYLEYSSGTGKYQLAPAVLSLGYAALPHIHLRQAARPLMQAFAEATGMAVGLGVRDRAGVLILAACPGGEDAAPAVPVGTRLPETSSAAGLALLAALPEAEQARRLARTGGRASDPAREVLAGSLAQVRARGFACAAADWRAGVTVAAAPVPGSAEREAAVLAAFGHSERWPRARTEREIGPRLAELGRRLSETR